MTWKQSVTLGELFKLPGFLKFLNQGPRNNFKDLETSSILLELIHLPEF